MRVRQSFRATVRSAAAVLAGALTAFGAGVAYPRLFGDTTTMFALHSMLIVPAIVVGVAYVVRNTSMALVGALLFHISWLAGCYYGLGGNGRALLVVGLMSPFIIIAGLVWSVPLALLMTLIRGRDLPNGDPALCSQCGYALHGLPSRRCPECGFEPISDKGCLDKPS